MRVRLTRKLAESVDGVDLSAHCVGDIVDVSPTDARLLILEKWAVPEKMVGAADTANDKGGPRPVRGRKRTDAG